MFTFAPRKIKSIMNLKSQLISVIRKLGGAPLLDVCRYHVMRLMKHHKNQHFKNEHPDVALPPAYLVYESFQMDYDRYYHGGKASAKWIADLMSPHLTSTRHQILDWGCGPARVIRHLPQVLGDRNSYHGCDYNAKTISWCQQHIPHVSFALNEINPPLPYQKELFNAVYGISIFTHLSEENHLKWIQELHRILLQKGIALITTHGEAFKRKLTPIELNTYDSGKLVIRSKAKEGQRMYAAFHPPVYLTTLFKDNGFEVISHSPGIHREDYIEQDTWILRKAVK